jgi:hypothetical protein
MHAPNIRVPKYIKQVYINGNRLSSVTAGNFNTPLATMSRSSKTENQQGNSKTDIKRTLQPITAKYIYFWVAHGISEDESNDSVN